MMDRRVQRTLARGPTPRPSASGPGAALPKAAILPNAADGLGARACWRVLASRTCRRSAEAPWNEAMKVSIECFQGSCCSALLDC